MESVQYYVNISEPEEILLFPCGVLYHRRKRRPWIVYNKHGENPIQVTEEKAQALKRFHPPPCPNTREWMEMENPYKMNRVNYASVEK